MDKVTYNVVYNRKNRFLANGTALIQIEAYLKGKKKYFSTNIYITPDQWDMKRRVIKNHPNKVSLNKQIREFIDNLENIEMQRRQSGKPFTLDVLKEYAKGEIPQSFLEFFKSETEKAKIKESTKYQYIAAYKHLKSFKSDVLFNDLNYEFISGFANHLRDKGLKHNTIVKIFSIVKKMINNAIDRDLFDLNKYPFRKFKIRQEKSNREYLTPEEVEIIENLQLPEDKTHLQSTLDMFLFAVYTGLRYSDVAELKPEALVINDGKEWLKIKMRKTEETIYLPVYLLFNGKALDIFCNYAGKQITVFPYLFNGTANKRLKEICHIAGIKKHVTFHVARHTQATYLLYQGVNMTTVQKLLGHRNIKTTEEYGKIMDKTIVNDLQKVSFSR